MRQAPPAPPDHRFFCRGRCPARGVVPDHSRSRPQELVMSVPAGESAPGAPAVGSPTVPSEQDRSGRRTARRRRPRHQCPRREPHQRDAHESGADLRREPAAAQRALRRCSGSTRPTGPAPSSTPCRRRSGGRSCSARWTRRAPDLEAGYAEYGLFVVDPGGDGGICSRPGPSMSTSCRQALFRRPTAATWPP